MIDTLIVAKDHSIFDEINEIFAPTDYNFEYSESTEAALDFLESEAPDFIFIVDSDFEQLNQTLESLQALNSSSSIAKSCFTPEIPREKRIALLETGSMDIIDMPISKEEFKMLFEKYCNSLRNGKEKLGKVMQGKVEDFNIIDIVQTLEDSKKSAILKLKRNGDKGQILISKGEICSAEYRKFYDMEAILNMIGWVRGDFYIEFTNEEFTKEIEHSNQDILMEAIQRIDERASYLKQLPPVDDILLIAPNLDLTKLPEKDQKYIKFFHGGNTVYQFLLNHTIDDLKLLDIAVKFYSKKYLLTREQFDSFKTEYETEVEQGGIFGFFSKMFKKSPQKMDAKEIAERRRRDKTQIINPNLDDRIRESVILVDPDELNEFKEKIQKL